MNDLTPEDIDFISESLDYYAANHELSQPDYTRYMKLIELLDDILEGAFNG